MKNKKGGFKFTWEKTLLLVFVGVLIFFYLLKGGAASTAVNTVQNYFTFMNLTNSTYLPFTGGQTGNNAVPFVTVSVGDNDSINESFSKRLIDVYFNSTGIIIQRVQSGNNTFPTNMTISVNVVEFKATSVKVQSGTFNISGANASTVVPIGTGVNTSAAALVFYYNSTDASGNYNSNSIMGNITNSSYINFTTGAAGTLGVKAGHWYVFESLDGGFSVQNVYLSIADTITNRTVVINSVQMNKTFLIGSATSSESGTDARDGGFALNLTNSTAIYGSRQAAGTAPGSLNATVFVITFTGNEFVQRGFFAYSSGVTDQTAVISSINTSLSMAWNPLLTGRMGDGSGGGFKYPQLQYLNISNSTAVTGHRDDNTISVARGSWEVIQWVAATGTDNPPQWSQNTTNATGGLAWNISGAVWDGPNSNFSTVAQDSLPAGIFFSSTGNKMFIVGRTNGVIFQYTLSQPWNTSTAVWDGPNSNLSVDNLDTSLAGIFFNSTGNKMFIVDYAYDVVYQYTLSQAWNTSTATYGGVDSDLNIINQDDLANGIFFNSTGNKMFIVGYGNGGTVYQYTLSQAWNTSTAVWDGPNSNLSVVAQDSIPVGIFFNSTGTKMYIVGAANSGIYQYTLSQAWNTSTAVWDGPNSNLSVTAQDNPNGIFFNSTGTKMFITGANNGGVYQYTLSKDDTSTAGKFIQHSVRWNDDTALSGYIFSFDNGTGTFTNDSFVTFTGTTNWSNISKWVNNTIGSTIQWYVWANDSINQINSTNIFSYVTTVAPLMPILSILKPENNTYFDNMSLLLNFSASLQNSTLYNLDNGTNITITENITFNTTEGLHTLYLFANNENGTTSKNVTFTVNTTRFKVLYSKYNGSTTVFNQSSYEEIQNLSGTVLEDTNYGKINFNQTINMTNDSDPNNNIIDLNSNTNISSNYIYINSTALPNLNVSATLSIYNLTFTNPRILRDGSVCPSTICTEVSYSGGTLVFNVTQFSAYSAEETPATPPPSSGSVGGNGGVSVGGGVIQCTDDSSCGENINCINGLCVKLFDIEITDFKTPAKLGEFFNFTYHIKTLTAINRDVVISFWIEKGGENISSGSDTVYLGTFDDKTINSKVFLPSNFTAGIYNFVIEVSYDGHNAMSQRAIEIQVKEGVVSIVHANINWIQNLIIPFLVLMIIVVLFLIVYRIREKININLSGIQNLINPFLILLIIVVLFLIVDLSGIQNLIIPFLILLIIVILFLIVYRSKGKNQEFGKDVSDSNKGLKEKIPEITPKVKREIEYNQRLFDYIKENLKKGYAPKTLRWALVKKGYSRSLIDKIIKKAKKELS